MATIKEACEFLGVGESTLSSKLYEKYKRKIGVRGVDFDLQQLLKDRSRDEEFLEKVKLFVEWCRHEKGISYRELARIGECSYSNISTHQFSFKVALRLARNVDRALIREFDEYYGW